MDDQVSTALDSGILTLTIQRPEQRNALDPAVIRGLCEALRQGGENRAVRAVALTGAGDRVFCAGADLKSALAADEGGEPFEPGRYRELLREILCFPKPTVALVRGHVLAGGLGLVLACDFALACDDIYFSTPEIHVGMFPMMVLALLYRHVGRKKSAEMLFLGERTAATAARDLGIINHIYSRPQFEAMAADFLRKLAGQSGRIVGLGKKAIRDIEDRGLLADLEYLESALCEVMSTKDSREGIRAFLEKRNPVWHDE